MSRTGRAGAPAVALEVLMKQPPQRSTDAAPKPPRQSATLQRLGIAAAEELRRTVRSALTSLFGEFLTRLPATLAEMEFKATDAREQHSCRELTRLVAEQAERWMDTFLQHVDANLVGGVTTMPERRPDATGSEDSVVLASAELRAEARHRAIIGELDNRVDRIRFTLYVPIYTRALAPAGLVRALQDTADVLGWPHTHRRVLFEKFDELVIARLGQLYQSLIESLKLISTAAARASTEAPAGGTEAGAGSTAETTAETTLETTLEHAPMAPPQPARPAPKVDTNTVSMLQRFSGQASPIGYNDGSLAADLLALAENKPVPGVAPDQQWIPLQRMALAGRFINDAIADPLVPEDLRSRHAAVRFPVVKSALADSTLFTAIGHPINSLVNDLMLKSATARVTGNIEARRAVERLEQVLVQFDLAPEFVREAMLSQQPIEEAQIQRFLEAKRVEAEERRKSVINESRRMVVHEIELSTFGRSVPTAVRQFLQVVWGPVLMKLALKYGAADARWTDGLTCIDQLLDLIEGIDPPEGPAAAWDTLMGKLRQTLLTEGMATAPVNEALKSLLSARPVR